MTSRHWPFEQPFPFDSQRFQKLRDAWKWSAERIHDFRRILITFELPPEICTIAISGSFARMEAHPRSDIDLLIIVDDQQVEFPRQRLLEIHSTVWEMLEKSNPDQMVQRPLSDGIFGVCALRTALVNSATRGTISEDMTTFGQRMQLLIDAQPLWGDAEFAKLQNELLGWYSEIPRGTSLGETGRFYWLRHDVLRYWHSLCSRAAWIQPHDLQKAVLIGLKLRFSRLLMISAALKSIDETHARFGFDDGGIDALQECLRKTPLQRALNCPDSNLISSDAIAAAERLWDFIRQGAAAGEPANSAAVSPPADVVEALQVLRTCLP